MSATPSIWHGSKGVTVSADPAYNNIERQIIKARLPRTGAVPYVPQVKLNSRGETEIVKVKPRYGPKRTKKGYVDDSGRIWIKDRSHSGQPEHWDVQIDDGQRYIKVDFQGNML